MPTYAPILQLGTVLIVPIPGDLSDQSFLALQTALLARIDQTQAQGLILDIGALEFVDSFMARVLNDITAMSGLLGCRVVVVGLSPAIAIVLMDLGLKLANIPTARDLESGLDFLRRAHDEDLLV